MTMTPDELTEAAHTLHNLAHRLFGDKPTPVPSDGWADVTEEVRELRDALNTAIRWLRRLELEHPGCLNADAIEKHILPALGSHYRA